MGPPPSAFELHFRTFEQHSACVACAGEVAWLCAAPGDPTPACAHVQPTERLLGYLKSKKKEAPVCLICQPSGKEEEMELETEAEEEEIPTKESPDVMELESEGEESGPSEPSDEPEEGMLLDQEDQELEDEEEEEEEERAMEVTSEYRYPDITRGKGRILRPLYDTQQLNIDCVEEIINRVMPAKTRPAVEEDRATRVLEKAQIGFRNMATVQRRALFIKQLPDGEILFVTHFNWELGWVGEIVRKMYELAESAHPLCLLWPHNLRDKEYEIFSAPDKTPVDWYFRSPEPKLLIAWRGRFNGKELEAKIVGMASYKDSLFRGDFQEWIVSRMPFYNVFPERAGADKEIAEFLFQQLRESGNTNFNERVKNKDSIGLADFLKEKKITFHRGYADATYHESRLVEYVPQWKEAEAQAHPQNKKKKLPVPDRVPTVYETQVFHQWRIAYTDKPWEGSYYIDEMLIAPTPAVKLENFKGGKGYGVVATRAIQKHETITAYFAAKRATFRAGQEPLDFNKSHSTEVFKKNGMITWIDGKVDEPEKLDARWLAAYVNEPSGTAVPNCRLATQVYPFTTRLTPQFPEEAQVVIVALQDINAGEEITVHYASEEERPRPYDYRPSEVHLQAYFARKDKVRMELHDAKKERWQYMQRLDRALRNPKRMFQEVAGLSLGARNLLRLFYDLKSGSSGPLMPVEQRNAGFAWWETAVPAEGAADFLSGKGFEVVSVYPRTGNPSLDLGDYRLPGQLGNTVLGRIEQLVGRDEASVHALLRVIFNELSKSARILHVPARAFLIPRRLERAVSETLERREKAEEQIKAVEGKHSQADVDWREGEVAALEAELQTRANRIALAQSKIAETEGKFSEVGKEIIELAAELQALALKSDQEAIQKRKNIDAKMKRLQKRQEALSEEIKQLKVYADEPKVKEIQDKLEAAKKELDKERMYVLNMGEKNRQKMQELQALSNEGIRDEEGKRLLALKEFLSDSPLFKPDEVWAIFLQQQPQTAFMLSALYSKALENGAFRNELI